MVIKSHDNVISSFGGRTPGFKTTKKSKSLGCSTLKSLIEGDKLEPRDTDIIYELSNFVAKGSSYEADTGNDDLAMCLVMFAYLTIQPAMEDITSVSAKNQILLERMRQAEEEMMPLGAVTDGTETEEEVFNF
jgi:propanediol dehydratase small subunit